MIQVCFTGTANQLKRKPKRLQKWRIRGYGSKLVLNTFTVRRGTCHPVHRDNIQFEEFILVGYPAV
jgi:hypothetical protein